MTEHAQDPQSDIPQGEGSRGSSDTDYDVVLLVEHALSAGDARRVHSLHEGLDYPVTYHVLLPLDDAAERITASMGSLSGGELLSSPGVQSPAVTADLERVRQESEDESETALSVTVAALQQAGATVATSEVFDDSPTDALEAKISSIDGREAVILTESHTIAEFFHVDWTSQARRKLGVPVLHLLEHETFDESAGSGGEGVTGF